MHTSVAALRLAIIVFVVITIQGSAQVNTAPLIPGPDPIALEKVNERPLSVIESSIKEYEALLANSPGDAFLLNNLGAMYYLAGRYAESQSMIRRAALQAPGSFRIRINWALAQYRTHNPAYAIATLQKVLQEDPKQAQARRVLCDIYQQEDRKAEAYDCYETLRSSGMMGAHSAGNFSAIMLERGEVDRAIELLRWAEANFPPDAGVKNGLGVALYRKKKYAEAERTLQNAAALEPGIGQVRYNLAITQMATEKRGAVLEQYKFLKTSDPELAGRLYRIIFRDKIISAIPRK